MSQGRRAFPPERLATAVRTAIMEIAERPNPARRHRTYPRVVKRAYGYRPSWHSSGGGIRHGGPPTIRLFTLQAAAN